LEGGAAAARPPARLPRRAHRAWSSGRRRLAVRALGRPGDPPARPGFTVAHTVLAPDRRGGTSGASPVLRHRRGAAHARWTHMKAAAPAPGTGPMAPIRKERHP